MSWWALIVAVIMALFSGVTFVAYRHPKGYRKIIDCLKPTVIGGSLIVIVFQIGGMYTIISKLYEVFKNSPNKTLETASYLITTLNNSKNLLKLIVLIGVPIIAYGVFLYFLPTILEIKENDKNT